MKTIDVNSISDLRKVPFFSAFTEDQLRAQYKANIEGLTSMYNKSVKTGRRVGGYTADQLKEAITKFENIIK